MNPDDLKPDHWYWLRRDDGSLAPYRFHRRRIDSPRLEGEFFVGSMLVRFPLSRVVGEACGPGKEAK